MGYDGVVFFKLTMETQSGKRKAEIGLPTSSRQQTRARVQSCLETHIPRNGHTLCRQNATITHFVKFVTTVFSLRMAVGIMNLCNCQSRTHRGIEQTVKTNSSVGEFYAPPSKTADSKVVSVTRAEVMLCVGELIVEQNIPLALALAP